MTGLLDPGAAAPATPAAPAPVPAVPDKFRDPATGAVRTDALLKSYMELERRLSSGSPAPFWEAGQAPDDDTRRKVLRALGVPDAPDGYAVRCDHGLFEPDGDINGRLHAAGFTADQAQLLYDLAAERMVPLIREVAAQYQAEREIERLHTAFGGPEGWRTVSRQILAWARANLPPAAVDGLAASYDGVMALHRMMTAGEPALGRAAGAREGTADEAELRKLMRDPRYWRDRDPALMAKVAAGFERLYPGEG
jgi:hypothetical protein